MSMQVGNPLSTGVSLMGMEIDHVTEEDVVAAIGDALARGQGGWVITPNLQHLRCYLRQDGVQEVSTTPIWCWRTACRSSGPAGSRTRRCPRAWRART